MTRRSERSRYGTEYASVQLISVWLRPLSSRHALNASCTFFRSRARKTADFGDAPDSDNALGVAMSAYAGTSGSFPTTSASGGPAHRNAELRYALGRGVTAEEDADSGTDPDGGNNLQPALDLADRDALDDGVETPTLLSHCQTRSLEVTVTAFDGEWRFPQTAYLNLWMDFDRSGSWGEQHACSGRALADEWAVKNFAVSLPGPGTHVIDLPAALMFNDRAGEDLWMRATLSSEPADAVDGRGPKKGFAFGETEDYRLEAVGVPLVLEATPVIQPFAFEAVPGPAGGLPNEVASQTGVVREVDVVHVGGRNGTQSLPIVVTAAGSGSAGKLATWSVTHPGAAPVPLHKSNAQPGRDHQVHGLAPDLSPNATYQMFVSGRISDGVLWLTSWRTDDSGALFPLDTRGYGPTTDVVVQRYTMAHSELEGGRDEGFRLVTPLIGDDDRLRMVTWKVLPDGTLVGLQDSGPVGPSLSIDTELDAAFSPGTRAVVPHFAVAARVAASDDLLQAYWEVDGAGVPDLRGSSVNHRTLQNDDTFQQQVDHVAIAALGDSGHLAVTARVGETVYDETVWDHAACADGTCMWRSFWIGDSLVDTDTQTSGIQIPLPNVNTDKVFLRDAEHERDLFEQNPDEVQAVASVRKVMVAIVALDAIEAGEVSLDDDVVVSAAAANVNNTGASAMGLASGEVISLRDLMYGNLIVSAGDATWAISEYVAGNLDNMLARMNAKATDLGLEDTFHCRSGTTFSSVSYSTAREQALLWEHVYDHELYLDFAGKSAWLACGTLNNQPICHGNPQLQKGMLQYPNLDGHKTGGGGGLCPELPEYDDVLTCRGGGCLSIQSTRLGRSLIATVFQPSDMPANTRFTDASTAFDFGFQQTFAPEYRGYAGGLGATDFAIDAVSDLHIVSAIAKDDESLLLCNWALDAEAKDGERQGCATLDFSGLALGPANVPATYIDVVKLSSLYADGDYATATRSDSGVMQVRMFRSGAK